MIKTIINDKRILSFELKSDGSYLMDSAIITPDIIEIRNGVFHVILNNCSYNAEVVKHEPAEKTFHIKVNNNVYKIQIRDRYDELLKELGMDTSQSKKISDLKAPMPGLVIEVAVKEGQEIKKGDKIIVLEAMKMENILKSPADTIIKKINVVKGDTVEKNELLILFS